METDLARILQGIDWEGIRGEEDGVSTASPAKLSPHHQNNGSLPFTEACAPVPVDWAAEEGAEASTSIPTQQLPAVQMAPPGGAYYVNPTPYQPVGMPPGHTRMQVPTQPLMFAPPNGQMVYMQVPYFRQPPYPHSSQPQRLYPLAQNPYYQTHFVQLPADGQVTHAIPQQPQQQYRAPQLHQSRVTPVSGSTQQQQQQQQQQSEFMDYQGGLVYLMAGSSLPQGAPFFPYGVRPTSHYTTPQTQKTGLEPPQYTHALWQAASQPADPTEGVVRRGDRTVADVPACPICGESNFISENVLRSHMRAKHDGNRSSSATTHNTDNPTNAAPILANDTAGEHNGEDEEAHSAMDQ